MLLQVDCRFWNHQSLEEIQTCLGSGDPAPPTSTKACRAWDRKGKINWLLQKSSNLREKLNNWVQPRKKLQCQIHPVEQSSNRGFQRPFAGHQTPRAPKRLKSKDHPTIWLPKQKWCLGFMGLLHATQFFFPGSRHLHQLSDLSLEALETLEITMLMAWNTIVRKKQTFNFQTPKNFKCFWKHISFQLPSSGPSFVAIPGSVSFSSSGLQCWTG